MDNSDSAVSHLAKLLSDHERSDEARLDDISARLIRIEEQHKHLVTMLTGHIEQEEGWQEQMGEALNGNGKPGIKTRLDRLEQFHSGLVKHFMLIWGAVLTVVVPLVIEAIKGHPVSK